MSTTLKERMIAYEQVSNFTLPLKLPVCIVLNGRGFKKTTSLLEKPCSEKFIEIMGKVAIRLATEIEGCVFIYSYNDEIVLFLNNNQTVESAAWYNNHLSKMISASAALASINFFKIAKEENINLIGESVFIGKAFILPNITEVTNYLIFKQQLSSQVAISAACFYELLKKFDLESTLNRLKNKTNEEKYDILFKECNIDIQSYPLIFWRGFACYRAVVEQPTGYGTEFKKKLVINTELPFFVKEPEFLQKIFFNNGYK